MVEVDWTGWWKWTGRARSAGLSFIPYLWTMHPIVPQQKGLTPGLLALCHPFFTPCRADHNGVPNQGLKCAWHVHSLQALLKLVAQFQVFQAAGPCDSFQALVEPLAKLQIFKAVGKDHLVQAAVEATHQKTDSEGCLERSPLPGTGWTLHQKSSFEDWLARSPAEGTGWTYSQKLNFED